MMLTGTQESSRGPVSGNSGQSEATTIESNEGVSFAHQTGAKPIEIDGRHEIHSVAFLDDGKHLVGGGQEGQIRRWRAEDGKEVGAPINAGSFICNIAVSRDGRWLVSGTTRGLVTVWNAESYSKVTEFKGHSSWVRAVDVSPDGTKIATGSEDCTVCVWSVSPGKRLLGPLEHGRELAAVKFSPNGRLIATATLKRDVRVYDSHHGGLLVKFPVESNSAFNQSLAWDSDSKQLFALSRDGNINRLDVSTGVALSKWAIHGSSNARCIALASNGTFIAASAKSSVSFWDTATHEQIGSVVKHTGTVVSMAISSKYDLVIGGDQTITLWGYRDILPSRYFDHVRLYEMTRVTSLSNHNPRRWLS